jgi:two-component system sensor histidine kinase UhpB
MSLRYQINLRIFFSAIVILVLGGSITIWQAREAIKDEVASSINLAVQLIEFSYKDKPSINFGNSGWLTQLNSLQAIRHLNIQLKTPSGKIISLLKQNVLKGKQDIPPQWFVSLVGSYYPV